MKFKAVVCSLLCIMLCSCAAVVVVGAAGGMAVYDRRSVVMMERDARIFYVVNKAITSDPRFRDSHIVVSSFNQVVLLVGETPTASLRVVAEKIVRATPNVRRVYDEIAIDYPASLSQLSKDSLITAKVRGAIMRERGLESGSIRIVTENGVVYLTGIVTHEQANMTVNVVRHVNGVNKVVKMFQYIV